uniref:Putative vacuolar protein sorting 8 log strongylocentrotus purpuratus n=1 Tax=Ixodes ricinus TaxID=34613 RepID=A0A0K8RAI1_IXORI
MDEVFNAIDAQLCTVVHLCQRSSSKMDTAEREALWFPLLEVVMAPQRELRTLLGPEQLGDFQALTHHLLGSMMGFVALPHILHKLMQDPVYSSGKFGEVRDFIMKMLDTHNYRKGIAEHHQPAAQLRSTPPSSSTKLAGERGLCITHG